MKVHGSFKIVWRTLYVLNTENYSPKEKIDQLKNESAAKIVYGMKMSISFGDKNVSGMQTSKIFGDSKTNIFFLFLSHLRNLALQKFIFKTKLCQKLYTVAFKYHEGLIDQPYPVNGALGYKYFQKESYEVPPAYQPGKFLFFSLLYML